MNCKEEPQYREKGKVDPYCVITCVAEAGVLDEPNQHVKLSNNAMIPEEDTTWMGSNYMAMPGSATDHGVHSHGVVKSLGWLVKA